MSMERIALVTDSTCDATDEELAALGVSCVNLNVEKPDGTPLAVSDEPESIERESIERGVDFSELGVRMCGPAITTHVGTGCVGFSYIRKAQR